MRQSLRAVGRAGALAALFCSSAFGATQQPTTPSEAPVTADKVINIHLRHARLADILAAISQATGRSFAADAYADDIEIPELNMKDMPLNGAVDALARTFSRVVVALPNVTVLRAAVPIERLQQEAFSARVYRIAHRPDGGLHMDPALLANPWDRFGLAAREVTFRSLADACAKAAGTSIRVDPDLADRRCSVFFPKSGTVADACLVLSALSRATPAASIGRTAAQRVAEEKEAADHRDMRTQAQRLSDELKESLMPALSDEQRARLQAGDTLDLRPDDFPGALGQKIGNYIQSRSQQEAGTEVAPDLSRLGEFSIQIRPEPGFTISVYGWGQNGRRILF